MASKTLMSAVNLGDEEQLLYSLVKDRSERAGEERIRQTRPCDMSEVAPRSAVLSQGKMTITWSFGEKGHKCLKKLGVTCSVWNLNCPPISAPANGHAS